MLDKPACKSEETQLYIASQINNKYHTKYWT